LVVMMMLVVTAATVAPVTMDAADDGF